MMGTITAPRQWSLVVKLPLTMASIVFSVALIFGTITMVREIKAIRIGLENNAEQLAQSIALQNANNVIRLDYWSMYASLRQHISLQHIGLLQGSKNPLLFGTILDQDGKVLSHSEPSVQGIGETLAIANEVPGLSFAELKKPVIRYVTLREKKVLLVGEPINVAGKPLASIWLAYDTKFIDDHLWKGGLVVALIASVLTIVSALAGWVVSRRMVGPLGEVTKAVAHIKAGKLMDVPHIKVGEKDEIGRLADMFNTMAADLKEKKKLESRLRHQEKLVAVGRMVSGVAHEINNPLGGMRNSIESLRLFGDDRTKREEAGKLLAAGLRHIEGVVQALLVTHRCANEFEVFDPRSFDNLFLLIRSDCEASGIKVQWENTLTEAFQAPCCALEQVLMNLLVNAVRAMPDGGVLAFRTWDASDNLVFSVEDTGAGIPEENMTKIFEPFFSTRREGVGLGLWVCHQLVDILGGDIEVESGEGVGSCFRIIVPKSNTSLETELEGNEPATKEYAKALLG